jgi:hypothetical protein
VSKPAKTLERVLRGTSDANIAFDDLCGLLRHLGFAERVKGSHYIFTRDGIAEILNLQSKSGKAKAYQVRQVREVLVKYGLAGEQDDAPVADEPPSGGGNVAENQNEQ